jgi:AcrR family transcriptional regulator
MAGQVNRGRRRYHSPLRADQAEQTRRRILTSAYRLFEERGYAGTTIAAVAEDAGVAPETVYVTMGDKRGLLEGVIELAIAGATDDTGPPSVAELAGAGARLDALVEYSCGILARTRPLHAVIRGAADKEPFAAELGQRLLKERLAAQTRRIDRFLAEDLRPGLSVDEAGQRYCVLASPELYYLLTVELGWSAERHQRWLAELLAGDLLRRRAGAFD